MRIFTLLLSGFLFITFRLHAQQVYIDGHVKDATTGESLTGAAVFVAGTTHGVTTNPEGYFRLPLREKDKTPLQMVVQFIGYAPDTLTFDPKNKTGSFDVRLQQSSLSLQEFNVTGRFEGQQKALYEQQNAANIKNVISDEQIKLFPDVNAAEAMQRIPGITLQRDQGEGRYIQLRGTPPALTNFNINGEQIPSPAGNVRYVGMDIIATDQISTIEITKALTPDMDADGIGGSINIVTKRATDSIPEISASVAGGYTDLVKGANYQAQFSYGQRYKKFGFHVNGNYYQNNQGAHNMEFKFVKRPTQEDTVFKAVYEDIQLRHYQVTRTRIGLSTTLDYNFSQSSGIYIKGMFNHFSDDETRRRVRHKFGSGTIINEFTAREASIERDIKDRLKVQEINTINAGGQHRIHWFFVDYMVSYALATETEPNRLEMSFDSDELNMQLDLAEPNWPRVIYPNASDSVIAHNYSDYKISELLLAEGLTTDQNIAYKANVRIPYQLAGNEGFFKFGTRIRNKHKERDNKATVYDNYYPVFLPGTRQVYLQEGPELSLATVAGGYEEDNLLNKGYNLGITPGPSEVRDFVEYYQQNFKIAEADTKSETYAEDYKAKEDIYAAYAMFSQDIGKLTLLGGARYERTDVHYQGYEIELYKGRFFRELKPMESKKTYEFILPQLHARYRYNKNTNLRAAATYTYSRPNFEDILPYKQQDIDAVRYGNSDLQFPLSFNLDLLAETYVRNNGLISGGLFYKKIDNFIFYYKRFVHLDSNFSTAGLKEVTMAMNGISAFVSGAEANLNFKFNFLNNWFRNFGIYSNYTYTFSEAYIDKRVPVDKLDEVFIYEGQGNNFVSTSDEKEMIPLPGQAQHTLNLALFYDTKKLYVKLSANYHSAFLSELGQEKDFDVYYDQGLHLDLNIDYRVTEQFRVFAQAVNLTNTPLRYYMGEPDRVKQQEYYSWSTRFGVRYTF